MIISAMDKIHPKYSATIAFSWQEGKDGTNKQTTNYDVFPTSTKKKGYFTDLQNYVLKMFALFYDNSKNTPSIFEK